MRFAVLVFVFLAVPGCLLSRTTAERNDALMGRLALNMTRDNVHSLMGTVPKEIAQEGGGDARTAYREETYSAGGHEWEVLFYQTGAAPSGVASDEDLTPVVLLDGRVVGWEWDFWRDIKAKNELANPQVR